jgi:hypothetical protein
MSFFETFENLFFYVSGKRPEELSSDLRTCDEKSFQNLGRKSLQEKDFEFTKLWKDGNARPALWINPFLVKLGCIRLAEAYSAFQGCKFFQTEWERKKILRPWYLFTPHGQKLGIPTWQLGQESPSLMYSICATYDVPRNLELSWRKLSLIGWRRYLPPFEWSSSLKNTCRLCR